MPELPEVETARRFAEAHLAGRVIRSVAVADDRIVFSGVAPRTFAHRLGGRRPVAFRRRGKHLWIELDTPPHPAFHLGMTGHFHLYEDPADRPRFWKCEWRLDDGARFAFVNVRRLGRIRLLADPEHEPPIAGLGPDPLLDPWPGFDFATALRARKAPVKAALLDQSFVAGIGNWIADEVLYQAGLDPRRRGTDLRVDECLRLHRALRRVIRHALAVEADDTRFPRTWLFHHRWGKNHGVRTARGDAIRFDTIGGRTTAWVPARQR